MKDEITLDDETLAICIKLLKEILDEICVISGQSEKRLVVSKYLDRLIVDYMTRQHKTVKP